MATSYALGGTRTKKGAPLSTWTPDGRGGSRQKARADRDHRRPPQGHQFAALWFPLQRQQARSRGISAARYSSPPALSSVCRVTYTKVGGGCRTVGDAAALEDGDLLKSLSSAGITSAPSSVCRAHRPLSTAACLPQGSNVSTRE